MEYKVKIYGKIGKKYFLMEDTTEDIDWLRERIRTLEKIPKIPKELRSLSGNSENQNYYERLSGVLHVTENLRRMTSIIVNHYPNSPRIKRCRIRQVIAIRNSMKK